MSDTPNKPAGPSSEAAPDPGFNPQNVGQVIAAALRDLTDKPVKDNRMFRSSLEISGITGALAAAQLKFRTPQRKTKVKIRMKTGGEYEFEYADLAEILDATRDGLAENGLCQFQTIVSNATSLAVVSVLAHKSGEWIGSGPLPVGNANDDPKDIGASITYMRRYALGALLGIAAEDDTDAPNNGVPERRREPKERDRRSDPAKTAPSAGQDGSRSQNTTPATNPPAPRPEPLTATERQTLGEFLGGEIGPLEDMGTEDFDLLLEGIKATGKKFADMKGAKDDVAYLRDMYVRVEKFAKSVLGTGNPPANPPSKPNNPPSNEPNSPVSGSDLPTKGPSLPVSPPAEDRGPETRTAFQRLAITQIEKLGKGKTYHAINPEGREFWFTLNDISQFGDDGVVTSILIAVEDPPGSKPVEIRMGRDPYEKGVRVRGEVVDRDSALPKRTSSFLDGAPAPQREELATVHPTPATLANGDAVSGVSPLTPAEVKALGCITEGEVFTTGAQKANAHLFDPDIMFDQGIEPLTPAWMAGPWIKALEANKKLARDARKLVRLMIREYSLFDRIPANGRPAPSAEQPAASPATGSTTPDQAKAAAPVSRPATAEEAGKIGDLKKQFGGKTIRSSK